MAVVPIEVVGTLPVQLYQQGGKGQSPLSFGWLTLDALVPEHRWAGTRLRVTGNNSTMWEGLFFRLQVGTTAYRGDLLNAVTDLVSIESLAKWQQFGSRDYALRKTVGSWFLGASLPFGRPVERARKLQDAVADTGGVLGWGYNSTLTTLESLVPNHAFGNKDTKLQTTLLDWFLGRTTGSEDMHVLYTRGFYR